MRGLVIAVSFLTRIPVRVDHGRTPDLGAALVWFPVVGLLVGAVQAGVYLGFERLTSPTPAAALAVIAVLLVTGAFHHDGLADMADAFGGGWDREQRLDILKDSRLGTYGVASLALALILEVALVADLDVERVAPAVVTAQVTSRALAVVTMAVAPTASVDGLAAGAASSAGRVRAGVALSVAVLVAALAFGVFAVVVVSAAVVPVVVVVALARAKIGGVTGDVLGAVQVLSNLALLLAAAAIGGEATTLLS